MTRTKRIYNKIQIRRGKWGELSFHPYKQLTMKCHCSICQGWRKQLDSKRKRCVNKINLRQNVKFGSNTDERDKLYDEDIYLHSQDPLAYLVPIYDDYLNFLNPCYDWDD
jgi:hypothetical protein